MHADDGILRFPGGGSHHGWTHLTVSLPDKKGAGGRLHSATGRLGLPQRPGQARGAKTTRRGAGLEVGETCFRGTTPTDFSRPGLSTYSTRRWTRQRGRKAPGPARFGRNLNAFSPQPSRRSWADARTAFLVGGWPVPAFARVDRCQHMADVCW